MAISDIKKARMEKMEAVRASGSNPYPVKSGRTHSIGECLDSFSELSSKKEKLSLAGRIISLRGHGGSAFLHFQDGTGKIQAYLKEDALGPEIYKFFIDNFDIGDFAEFSGTLFETKKGEKTIDASSYKMLAKSLLPLPEKWHGLKDIEERFRKRYLDLIMNPEVKERIVERSGIIKGLRDILSKRGFLEVETPILQSIPGGAAAKPFKTHINSMDMDLYLRVAPELYLKRLLIGGFEKVYEIGRCFRNEGVDKYHNPDFTMMELYWAYQEKEGLMAFTEDILKNLILEVKKSLKIAYEGNKIDFSLPFKRAELRDIIKESCNIDIDSASEKDLAEKNREFGIKPEDKSSKAKLIDDLYKKVCREKMIQPTFVTSHPIEMAVLAKQRENNPKYADRFQLVVGGIELVNAFSELNDPLEQEKRFSMAGIGEEKKDEDFIEALQYGMPPAAGMGMGIDRLAILLTDSPSLREVIIFPTMKRK